MPVCLQLSRKNLSFTEAAAIPLACETSYQALFNQGMVTKDSKVFICGGATATGMFAIQLAKLTGAKVATTCSARNVDLIKKLGYNVVQNTELGENGLGDILVIDYNSKDFGTELKGQQYDIVYDCVGGQQQWTSAQQIMKPGGKFITIVGDDQRSNVTLKAIGTMGAAIVNRKFWSVFGNAKHSYILHYLRQSYENLDILRENYFETGKMKPIIDKIYDFNSGSESLHQMYERSKSGKAQGKLILKFVNDEE